MRFRKLLLLLYIACSSLGAQNSQWQNYGIREGLPQSSITSITQDSVGYLWLGTKGSGLVQFDGKIFKTFSEKDSLRSGFVNHLLFQNDSLFIATNQGLAILYQGKISNYKTPKINKIISIKDDLFLATDLGIYQWVHTYVQPLKIDYEIDLIGINDLAFYDNQYWIATEKGLWSTLSIKKNQNAVLHEKGHFSTITPTYNGLFVSETTTGIYKRIDKYFVLQKGIKEINSILLTAEFMYVSTADNGIQKLDLALQSDTKFNSPELRSESVKATFIDSENNLWVASDTKGLYKYTENNFEHFTTRNGLSNNRINAITAQKSGLWVATANKDLLFHFANGFLTSGLEELKNTTIHSIAIDSSNNIWLASKFEGLLLLKHKKELDSIANSRNSDILVNLDIVSPSYEFVNIGNQLSNVKKSTQLVIAKDNLVWVFDGNQIHQLTTDNGIILNIKSFGKNEGLKDSDVQSFLVSNSGLWYGTNSGNLGRIQNNQMIDYYQITGSKTSITSLAQSADHLFIGTSNNGVWVTSKNNPKEVFQLTGIKKINSKNIRQLLYDTKGNLWVGTEKGINKVVLENNAIKDVFYFSKNDGFLGVETSQNAITELNNGSIWFGTSNGLTKLKSNQETSFKKAPKIYFESISVNFENIVFQTSKDTIYQFNPSENNISFRYKTVDLSHPNTIEYNWILNENKSPWTDKSFIDFASLDYGDYTLEIKSRNRDFIESKPVYFKFTIQKPWYLEDLFFLCAFVLLVLVSWILISVSLQRIKKKSQQRIEKLELENSLISLEQKALQLQMNPHFIFNVLNGIKAMGTNGKLKSMNETINEFATLLRGILQSSREEFSSLQSELNTLRSYIHLEQKLSAKYFGYDIDLKLDGIDAEEILIPTMLIQPFIENSIKHGFHQLEKEGKVTLTLEVHKKFIYCSIVDNGVGYKTSQKEKKKHHKSVAIDVTKERLKSLITYPNFLIKEITKGKEIYGTVVSFHMPYKIDF